jgi:PAS domain S-box-containing protein
MTDGADDRSLELSRFETLLVELSTALVAALPTEVDAVVTATLERAAGYLEVDRAAVGRPRADGSFEVTHSWEGPGIEPAPRVPLERFTWYTEEIRRGRRVVLERLPDDLPADAVAERDYALTSGIKAQLTIPLNVAGEPLGAFGFAGFRRPRPWPPALVRRMRLFGELIGVALARRKADDSLRRSEARLRGVLESLPDALLLLRADGSVSFANEAASRMAAMPRAALLDLGIERLLPDLDDAARIRALEDGAGSEHRGLVVRRGDGTEARMDARLVRLGSGERELVCALRRS